MNCTGPLTVSNDTTTSECITNELSKIEYHANNIRGKIISMERAKELSRLHIFNWSPEETNRIALIPILHSDIWEMRKKIKDLHWNVQQVDLSHDKKDWATLSKDQQHFVKGQLAFFAIINNILFRDFNLSDQCMEARMAFTSLFEQNCVHVESYSLQIAEIMNNVEYDQAYKMPIIEKVRKMCQTNITERLIVIAAIKSVLFSSGFYCIKCLPGINTLSLLISRDNDAHTNFLCLLIRQYLKVKPTYSIVSNIFNKIILMLDEFMEESLPVKLIGIDTNLLKGYVRIQADSLLINMGYAPLFNQSLKI
jgi:ribonucleotide reductase beta subunit family protein with ferritin-like domain